MGRGDHPGASALVAPCGRRLRRPHGVSSSWWTLPMSPLASCQADPTLVDVHTWNSSEARRCNGVPRENRTLRTLGSFATCSRTAPNTPLARY